MTDDAPRPAGRPWRPLGALALAALLGACGGGGDASGGETDSPASAGAMAPARCGIADFTAQALERINQRRAAGASCGSRGSFGPAPPMRWSDALAQAAAAHATDMAAQNYFSHTSADGRSLGDRVGATGYAWTSLGENIAAGYPDIDTVIAGWMRSDGHCANLMNPAFDEVGLACAPGAADSTYRQYWTQVLARARGR